MRCFLSVFLGVSLLVLPNIACGKKASTHYKRLETPEDQKLTLGKVQKEIKIGMSQTDVVSQLGSPNIVTKDKEGTEAWVYDKMDTEVLASDSSHAGSFLFWGWSGSDSATKRSQRTLTVVVKFDKAGAVKDVTYHSSSF